MKKMTKGELAEARASLHDLILKGNSPDDIMATLYWDAETYEYVKSSMLDDMAEAAAALPREHHFIEYKLAQSVNVKALDDMVDTLDSKKQYNAVVGAIRLRSEIADKVLARAMDLGVVRKEPNRTESVNGVLVGDLSDKELREAIVGLNKDTSRLMRTYGSKSLLELPEPIDLHHGPTSAALPEKPKKPPKSKVAKKKKAKKRKT